MIKIINYNNIIDIDIEIQEPIKTKTKIYYLDPIIGNRSTEIELCKYIYFIFFLQNNQDATKLVPIELYNEIMKIIKEENKKLKRKFLKSTSPYIQAFFNHNNQYISAFCDCIEIIVNFLRLHFFVYK